jgi:hypothetical protein
MPSMPTGLSGSGALEGDHGHDMQKVRYDPVDELPDDRHRQGEWAPKPPAMVSTCEPKRVETGVTVSGSSFDSSPSLLKDNR